MPERRDGIESVAGKLRSYIRCAELNLEVTVWFCDRTWMDCDRSTWWWPVVLLYKNHFSFSFYI